MLQRLTQQAQETKDAKLLAFVALRSDNRHERDKLAEMAVRLSPDLTWVLAHVAGQDPCDPEAGGWVRTLRTWDPQNSLPYLLEAKRLHYGGGGRATVKFYQTLERNQQWRDTMMAAFEAPKYDSYVDRRFELDRAVARALNLNDPRVLIINAPLTPVFADDDLWIFERELFKSAHDQETLGNFKNSETNYWRAARFGQRLEVGAQTTIERMVAGELQTRAYQSLAALAEKRGDRQSAEFLRNQATLAERLTRPPGSVGFAPFAYFQQTAMTVHVAALLMLLSTLFLTVWAVGLIARRFSPARQDRSRLLPAVTGIVGAVGLLFS